MASDDRVLPFEVPPDDTPAELVARLRASYAALPEATDAQVAACRSSVLRAATPGRRILAVAFSTRRRQWWWGGAAAAALLAVATIRPVRLADASKQAVDSSAAVAVLPEGGQRSSTAPSGSSSACRAGSARSRSSVISTTGIRKPRR